MDGFDDLDQPQPDRRAPTCHTCIALSKMESEQRAKVEAALERPPDDPLYWENPALADRLQRAGYDVSESSIRGHRKKHG